MLYTCKVRMSKAYIGINLINFKLYIYLLNGHNNLTEILDLIITIINLYFNQNHYLIKFHYLLTFLVIIGHPLENYQ
jgi:hypothetical protein